MTALTEMKSKFLKAFPAIPKELREGYQVDVQSENARRLKILGFIVAGVSLTMVFLRFSIVSDHEAGINKLYLFSNIGIIVIAVLAVCVGHFSFKGVWDIRPRLFSLILQTIGVCLILWAFVTSFFSPVSAVGDWIYMGAVFTVLSLLLFSFSEIIFISVIVISAQIGISELTYSSSGLGELLSISVISFFIAGLVSRILYFSRIRNYMNWENINQMNHTLKREVSKHLKATDELKKIRKDLNHKVHDQTKDLRAANQRLSEEIADRRFADKVRNILYRISNFVNQNQDLDQVFQFIHSQLESIMEVKSLIIAKIADDNINLSPVFQSGDFDQSFLNMGSRISLTSLVVQDQHSILLDRKEIQSMIRSGKLMTMDKVPESCLAVPLLFEETIIGIQIVQSFKKGHAYDRTDLELLEYVSEHVAQAITRKENDQTLIRAKEKAEESDRLKSSFLANLSHEIRTPMNAIVGFSELIGNEILEDEERKNYSAQVVNNSHYLLELISNIIELSKIQSGEVELLHAEQDIMESLNSSLNTCNELKVKLERTHLSIDIEMYPELEGAVFEGDPDGFKQVMLCLVENALKFTHEGGVKIGVKPYNKQFIVFYVKDTGIGIDESEIEHIFDYFRQGSLATRRLYRGTGLGLALAKALVEEQGGQIWVESKFQAGSCFSFTMKLLRHIPTIKLSDSASGNEASARSNINRASAG